MPDRTNIAPRVFADNPTSRQNADVIRQFFAEVLARRNPDAATKFLSEDYHDSDPAPGSSAGREGVVEKLSAFWTAFPDGAFDLLELVAAGDRVFARSLFTGKQAGAFGPMPPSGRSISIAFFDLYVLKDGRISGHHHIFDEASMMRQLSG